jgi:hypothetical protein
MRARRMLIAVSGLVVLIGGLAWAPAASAATVSVDVDCTGPVMVTANPGDTIVFNFAATCNGANEFGGNWELSDLNGLWSAVTPGPNNSASGFLTFVSSVGVSGGNDHYLYADDWFSIMNVASGTTSITTTLNAVDGAGNPLIAGSTIASIDNQSQSGQPLQTYAISYLPASNPAGLPMWLQSTGRVAATTTCPDGFSASWAMWPNNGTGGYVCDRFVRAYGN